MPSQNLDPSNAHLKAAGQRLQDARLAQDISVDTVRRELKVTRMQIAGIEAGNPKSFYNERFFVDLLKRYARLLNFSEAAIAKMVSPPVVEPVASPVLPTDPVPAPVTDPAPAPEVNETPQASSPDPVVLPSEPAHTAEQSLGLMTSQDPEVDVDPLNPVQSKRGRRVIGVLVVLVLVGAGVALGLQMGDTTETAPAVVPPPVVSPSESAAPAPATSAPAASDPSSSQPSAAAASPASPAGPTAPAPAPAPVEPAKPAPEKPSRPAEAPPVEKDQALTKTIVDTPMTLTAKQKSWIWVRDANDQVRQFGVAQGETVKFDQLPIFIVVYDPTVFEVMIGKKPIPLVRNTQDRNVARHTRTELINYYQQ